MRNSSTCTLRKARSASALAAAVLLSCGPAVTALGDTTALTEMMSRWSENEAALKDDGTQVPGGCPIESPAGRFLFTARNPGTGLDIYVNQRSGNGDTFAPGNVLPTAISDPDANDFCPTPLRDGELYFVSTRVVDSACGGADMYRSVDNPATGYAEPENLGCHPDGPNTPGTEFSPAVIETSSGTFLYYSSDYPTGDQNLYVSAMRDDGTFGPGEMLPFPINTEHDDRQPNLSQNGLEIVFASDRPSSARDESGIDIFYSRRGSLAAPWRTPINLSERVPFSTVDTNETRPSFSWDGRRLYYGSGGVWISTR